MEHNYTPHYSAIIDSILHTIYDNRTEIWDLQRFSS